MSPRARKILGLVAATLTAPFVVGLTAGVLVPPFSVPVGILLGVLAVAAAWPISLVVAVFVGMPAVHCAYRLRTSSAWYYVGCGLLAGLAGMALMPNQKSLWPDPVVYPAGGLAASLVYWLIAERGRSKDPDAEF